VKNKLKQLADAGAKIIMDSVYNLNKDKNFISAPYYEANLKKIGIDKDLEIYKNRHQITWTHRTTDSTDIYFLSNQSTTTIETQVSFGVKNKILETASFTDGNIYRIFDLSNDRSVNVHNIHLNARGHFHFQKTNRYRIHYLSEEDEQSIPLNEGEIKNC
jgi:hypothetical protein